jgi:hypothetical protein
MLKTGTLRAGSFDYAFGFAQGFGLFGTNSVEESKISDKKLHLGREN